MWEKYCGAGQATDVTIWRTCIACWITKAANTHSEYVILKAFPQQQWSHEYALLLLSFYVVSYSGEYCPSKRSAGTFQVHFRYISGTCRVQFNLYLRRQ